MLFSTFRALSFFAPSLSKGLTIPYPMISLHAISRTPMRPWLQPGSESANGSTEASASTNGDSHLETGPCIFCQLDEEDDGKDGEGEGDEDFYATKDFIITPSVTADSK